MKQAIILLCGVPGSGKTWVLQRLAKKFATVQNDEYIAHTRAHLAGVVAHVAAGDRPVLVDCPFGEREFKAMLEGHGLEVYPFFVVEPVDVVAQRYMTREGKPASQATLTRATTIADRAREWGAPAGTADEILEHLRELVVTPAQ